MNVRLLIMEAQSESEEKKDNTPDPVKPGGKKGSLAKKIIILILLVIVLGSVFFAGFVLGRRNNQPAPGKTNQLSRLNNPNDPMFANLQGSIYGKIIKIEGSKVYIESEKGGKGIYSIEDPVLVSEISGGKLVELGNTRDKIRLNENAAIKITGLGNGYRIFSVTYLKDSPPTLNPQESTKSASPSAVKK